MAGNDDAISDSDPMPTEQVLVPNSYPASDAAKYFIPAGQRGPAQLGGPPPMDLPFGERAASGAESDSKSGTFSPPAAPGQ